MKILFVQPIFCPNNEVYDKNLKSIQSLINYFNKYPFEKEYNIGIIKDNKVSSEVKTGYRDIDFIFGGWNYKENYFEELDDLISYNFNVRPKKYDKNYGKAYIVNDLIKNYKKDYDYIFTCDSDIIFDSNCSWIFEKLLDYANNIEIYRKVPIGIIAPDMRENNCHYTSVWENQFVTCHSLFGYPNSPSGIAGGCIFTSKKAWETIGGYREIGCYAGDDACYLLDCHNNGFNYQVCKDIWIIHPFEKDQEYQNWKIEECQRSTKSFNDSVNYSTSYWMNNV